MDRPSPAGLNGAQITGYGRHGKSQTAGGRTPSAQAETPTRPQFGYQTSGMVLSLCSEDPLPRPLALVEAAFPIATSDLRRG